MSDALTSLAEGGVAVVVLAREFELPKPYDLHPQVVPIPFADFPGTLPSLSSKFPSNTRIVVIAGELSSFAFGLVVKTAQRRTLPYIHRRTTPALLDALKTIVPHRAVVAVVEPEPPPDPTINGAGDPAVTGAAPPGRGNIKAFAKAEADLTKGAAEEARRLFVLAQQRGIPTTFASLAQSIGVLKREGGRTGVPKSIMSGQQRALATLNEAIAGLELIREYVEQTEKDNADLRAKVARFKKALEE